MWDQNLYIDDKLVSSVSTSMFEVEYSMARCLQAITGKGEHGEIFYISIECAAGTCSTAPAHSKAPLSC